jgi:hypothetical protein
MGIRPLKFEKLLNVREWRKNRRFLKNMASHYSINSIKPIFIISHCSFATHFVFEWLCAKAFWCVMALC